jgi:integrase/recombinase XerD
MTKALDAYSRPPAYDRETPYWGPDRLSVGAMEHLEFAGGNNMSTGLPRMLVEPGREIAPLPALSAAPVLFLGLERNGRRFWEFFTANIHNPNTRRAYFAAAARFSDWCLGRGLQNLDSIEPIHVAAWIQDLGRDHSRPTVKQHLAAIRILFDWLVVGQVMPHNPASSVRGPKHTARRGKTPVLSTEEMRDLLGSIETATILGLRDRALIGLMGYTFARVGAALAMRVEDYYIQGRRGWVRLREKGGKVNEMPAHHRLEEFLDAYIGRAGIASDPEGPLFRAWRNGELVRRPLEQSNVHHMIRRRAQQAEIATKIGCHSFRATGITNYLKNGGRLEIAQQMAGHESSRTTGLYDRRGDEISLDEVERISY